MKIFIFFAALTLSFMSFGSQKRHKALEVKIALSSFPQALKNPFFATDSNSQNVHRLVHTSLTDIGPSMNFSCRLCKSFKEDIKGSKHHLVFKLKQGLKFWDGEEVDAYDVESSWKYFTDKKNIKSIFRFAFSKIEKVVVHNKYKVELIYKTYSPDNLSDLSLFKVLKVKKFGEKKFDELDIVGAGPYQYGEIKDLSFRLLPVEKSGRPSFLFKTVKDETTLTLKLINREVDLSLIDFSPRKLSWLKKNKEELNLNFWEQESSNYKYIGINHKNKHLKDRLVRKALSHLIPRKDLLKYKLSNAAVLSRGLFSDAFNNSIHGQEIDNFDPTLAKNLLKKAGYKKANNGFFQKDGVEIRLRWRISNNKNTYELVKTIQNSLEQNGIRVFVVRNEWGAYYRAFKRGDFDLVLGSWIGFTGPDFFNSLFHSKSLPPRGRNRGRYGSDTMDRLLDDAVSMTAIEKRNAAFEKVQKFANNEYVYLNLWHPKVLWVGRNCIEKIKIFPNGSFYPLLKIRNLCGLEAKWKKKHIQKYQ